MTRRRRDEGSITRRKDGRYQIRIDLGKDPDGRRIRRYFYERTEASAIECLRRELRAREAVVLPRGSEDHSSILHVVRRSSAKAQEDSEPVPQLEATDFDPRGYFVYILWADDPDRPLYVGQSRNVLARIGSHMQATYGRRVRRVTLVRCRNLRHMVSMERRMIWRYHPELNISLNRRGA